MLTTANDMTAAVASNKTQHAPQPSRFNGAMTRLATLIRMYRAMEHQTVQQCATEMGLNTSTLARLERSEGGMTAENFLKVLTWLLGPAPQRGERGV